MKILTISGLSGRAIAVFFPFFLGPRMANAADVLSKDGDVRLADRLKSERNDSKDDIFVFCNITIYNQWLKNALTSSRGFGVLGFWVLRRP